MEEVETASQRITAVSEKLDRWCTQFKQQQASLISGRIIVGNFQEGRLIDGVLMNFDYRQWRKCGTPGEEDSSLDEAICFHDGNIDVRQSLIFRALMRIVWDYRYCLPFQIYLPLDKATFRSDFYFTSSAKLLFNCGWLFCNFVDYIKLHY